MYETGRCFAEFRSFRETEKNTKIRKKCFELFRETAKQCFVSYFRIFSFNFVPSLRISSHRFDTPTHSYPPSPSFTITHTHQTHSSHTHLPHTLPTHTHNTHSLHKLTTHTQHTHSPHTLTTYTHHIYSPHTLTTHTH